MKSISAKQVLKITLSVGLLVFLLSHTGVEDTFRQLSTANLWYIPVGVMIYLASQAVSSYRWQFLSEALGFRLSLRELYDYYLIGMYFSLFLPGSIGGDVGRMVYLAKSSGRKKREALLTLLAERGVGLVALLLMTSVVCLLPVTEPIPAQVRYGLLALSGLGVVGYGLLQVVPLERWAGRVSALNLLLQAQVYWKDVPLLVKSVAVSMLVHTAMVLLHLLIAQALGVHVPVLYLMAVYGIVSLVSVLPIFFNGIGVREGAYQFLLVKAGLSPHTALAFGLYWFLISTCTSLMGGLVLVKGHYKTPTPQDADVIEA